MKWLCALILGILLLLAYLSIEKQQEEIARLQGVTSHHYELIQSLAAEHGIKIKVMKRRSERIQVVKK